LDLLQSAIIPSFRDPSSQLRINNYTWYGKFLREFFDKTSEEDKKELAEKFEAVNTVASKTFEQITSDLNKSNIKIAFPETKVSFRFNPEQKHDYYKNTLIYVDDGFSSLLEDKGSGIQSATIIGLFDHYTRTILNKDNNTSLLAIEEPELYLHPHGRRTMAGKLDAFVVGNEGLQNQLIITTHCEEFINFSDSNLNLILVTKSKEDGTVAKNICLSNVEPKQILLKNNNAEMFFADLFVLVEGQSDKYILQGIAEQYGIDKSLGQTWCDDRNISIITVGGKGDFKKYTNILDDLEIPYYIMADFDFFCKGLSGFLKEQSDKDALNAITAKLGTKDISFTEEIESDLESLRSNLSKIIINENNVTRLISNFSEKIMRGNKYKNLKEIPEENQKEVQDFIVKMKTKSIFILTGELEDFYKNSIFGSKEQKALSIRTESQDPEKSISDFVETQEFNELLAGIDSKIKPADKDLEEVEPIEVKEEIGKEEINDKEKVSSFDDWQF
jgi:putative ATP-dependent endonuclease of the OLD family